MIFELPKHLNIASDPKNHPYYVKLYLENLCTSYQQQNKLATALFSSQQDLADAITSHYSNGITFAQYHISRALVPLLAYDLIDSRKNRFRIVPSRTGYFLKPRDVTSEMEILYEAPNIFIKDSVYQLTDSTLIFQVIPNKDLVKDFVNLLKSTFSRELFWGIYRQGTHLHLLFNKNGLGEWTAYYKAFSKFFEGQKEHLGENEVLEQIRKTRLIMKKKFTISDFD